MKPAEFEEREYEAPLYNQLERGLANVWSPGQVLEGRVGIDRGLFVSQLAIWEVLGYSHIPRGAVLSRILWPPGWGPRVNTRPLPSYRLNLFIQAKRSMHSQRPPRAISNLGLSGSIWAFEVDPDQQQLLDVLENKCTQDALVSYAAPVFHEVRDLYRHTTGMSIISNSTFPPVSRLSGHSRWYYQQPGAIGVANPDPNKFDEPSLQERIEKGIASSTKESSFSYIWSLIQEAVDEPKLHTIPQLARFSNARLELERNLEPFAIDEEIRAWADITLFCEVLGVLWLIAGTNPQEGG